MVEFTFYKSTFINALENISGDKPILIENGKQYFATQLYNDSLELAKKLYTFGIIKESKVVMAVKPGYEFLKIFYANLFIGSFISIIDPEMGKSNYKSKFDQFNPDFCFVDSRILLLNEHPIIRFLLKKFKNIRAFFPSNTKVKLISTGFFLPLLKRNKHINFLQKIKSSKLIFENKNQDEEFLLVYTSGTISEPKGVVHSINTLKNSIYLLTNLFQKDSNNKTIATHLPHFILLGISAQLLVYIWDNNLKPKDKLNFIEENNITTLFGPPSDFVPIINFLENENRTFPASLTNCYFGSAPVYTKFLKKFYNLKPNIKTTCLYGMTENLLISYIDGKEKIENKRKGDLLGYLVEGMNVNFDSDQELCINSNQLFLRYFHEEKLVTPHHTGDIAYIDENKLYLKSRKKDMIIRGNFNLYPALYEPTINQINNISDSVLIGIFNEEKQDEEVYLVIEKTSKIKENEVWKLLKESKYSIDYQAMPDYIIFESLPYFGRQNKVNKNLLKEIIAKKL